MRVPDAPVSGARRVAEALGDLVAGLPDWVVAGWIILMLNAASWLPIGAAWLILSSIGGLR